MKKSQVTIPNNNWVKSLLEPGFELPEDPDFVSVTPKMTYAQFIALSEQNLPLVNSNPETLKFRLKTKFTEPFKLLE